MAWQWYIKLNTETWLKPCLKLVELQHMDSCKCDQVEHVQQPLLTNYDYLYLNDLTLL